MLLHIKKNFKDNSIKKHNLKFMIFSVLISMLFVIPIFAQSTLKIKPLSKVPKSLFLIKKAKIDNDMGEPVIYPAEKQSKLIMKEKVFLKYRLNVLEED